MDFQIRPDLSKSGQPAIGYMRNVDLVLAKLLLE